jgi:translation elongation factor EF-4
MSNAKTVFIGDVTRKSKLWRREGRKGGKRRRRNSG